MLQFPLKAVIFLSCLLIGANTLQNIEDVLLGEKFVIPALGPDETEEDNWIEDSDEDYLNGTSTLLLDQGKKAKNILKKLEYV